MMAAPTLMAAYVLVAVLNVIAEATANDNGIQLTKPLLMPLLLAWLIAMAGRWWPSPLRWLGIGLVFAWAGDMFLMGDADAAFQLGLGAFLVMQVCYIVAYQRVPGPGLVRAWPIALIPYALIWIVLVALVWSGAGQMRIPVLVYSAVIVTMAVAALDLVLRLPQPLAWRVAAGALVFVLSDALIALTAFGPLTESVRTSAAVMLTYTVAQGLIVTGLTHGVLATMPRPAAEDAVTR
jgi:uncharacterized membrane protein YhhN